MTNTSSNLGIYGQLVSLCNVNENRIENLRSNSTLTGLTTGAMQAIYFTSGDNINVTRNNILRCRPFQTFYGINMVNQNSAFRGVISGNILRDIQSTSTNFTFPWMYGIWANGGAWDVSRNYCDEMIQQGPYGYLVPFYASVSGTGIVQNWFSNVVTNSISAYYTWGLYSNVGTGATLNFRQNTMNFNMTNSPYGWSYYSHFHYGFGLGNTNFDGNILVNNTLFSWGMYYGTNTTNVRYSNNHLWAPNATWTPQFFSPASGNLTDYTSWRNAGFGGQVGDMRRNPRFVNGNNRNLLCQDFFTQNNVSTLSPAINDYDNRNRNRVMSDRGGYENFMDLQAVSTDFSVPSTVCAGWSKSARIVVRNLFATDTAYNFNVAYSINGGPKTTARVTKRLLTNDTANILFATPIQLNATGPCRVAIFIDIPDDNTANDSFIFNTNVLPAPGGGRYTPSSTPTTALYQRSRTNDVTQVNVPVYYSVNAPRKYSNSTYWDGVGSNSGKEWTASTYATSKTGRLLSGSASISKHASATNDLEVKFQTSDLTLEDSFVTFFTKITDLGNGCDTIIRRDILIYPTIVPDFSFPTKICDGDLVAFIQKSKVKSGTMEFFWEFGTGKPADTSGAIEPVFEFPAAGTYKVIMTGRTLPYGFAIKDTGTVVVNPNPSVKFTKQNACEGQDLIFNNLTTPTTGVNSTWNFGDGKTLNSNNSIVRYKYAKQGAYLVTLTANLNGCIASTSQRAFQLPTPKAAFDLVDGFCSNDKFTFKNKSSIATGSFGSLWKLEPGVVSTDDDAAFAFTTPGVKNVILSVVSEFGCKDTLLKKVTVLESPKTTFINTPTCSRTPASFTNTTPTVGGAGGMVKTYSWDFGDGKTAIAENPQHQFTSLGPKKVTFSVELMNGCKATYTKEIKVGIQAKASFTVNDVCLGSPATFINNTTWPQGKISYLWNFGDGTTSTSTNPVHVYNKSFSPNVTLYAIIEGGCTDSLVLNTFDIFEGPRTCDFSVKTDYAYGFHGIAVNPLNANTGVEGGQDKVDYTWIFETGGTVKTSGVNAQTQHNFQKDGTFNVTMRARSQNAPNCECSVTKQVIMNRASVRGTDNITFNIYPNPNNGHFNLVMDKSFGNNVIVEITDMSGKLVKQLQGQTISRALSVDGRDLADGAYMVKVSSGNKHAVARMMITR